MPRSQNLVEHSLQARVTAGLCDYDVQISRLRSDGMNRGEKTRPDLRQIEPFLWKLHRPRDGRGATVEFAVDEIRAAPEKQTDRRDHGNVIGQAEPRNALP